MEMVLPPAFKEFLSILKDKQALHSDAVNRVRERDVKWQLP